jgi:hypothetical protein
MSATGGAAWVREEILPKRTPGESPTELVRRLTIELPSLIRTGAAEYFPDSKNPEDDIRRSVQREMDSQRDGGRTITVHLADVARLRSSTDRTMTVHTVVNDLLAQPGGPAYVVEQDRHTGQVVLHLATGVQESFGKRRGNRITVGTLSYGWDEVDGDLYFPDHGSHP